MRKAALLDGLLEVGAIGAHPAAATRELCRHVGHKHAVRSERETDQLRFWKHLATGDATPLARGVALLSFDLGRRWIIHPRLLPLRQARAPAAPRSSPPQCAH